MNQKFCATFYWMNSLNSTIYYYYQCVFSITSPDLTFVCRTVKYVFHNIRFVHYVHRWCCIKLVANAHCTMSFFLFDDILLLLWINLQSFIVEFWSCIFAILQIPPSDFWSSIFQSSIFHLGTDCWSCALHFQSGISHRFILFVLHFPVPHFQSTR